MDPAVMPFAYYINSSIIALIANWINSSYSMRRIVSNEL